MEKYIWQKPILINLDSKFTENDPCLEAGKTAGFDDGQSLSCGTS